MKYISNRIETEEELDKLRIDLFNWKANVRKINEFKELYLQLKNFIPSDRCKDKKCVFGPSCGNLDSKIIFIGEAPGRFGAERTQIPLYGDITGDNFENILFNATNGEITRKDVFITNTFFWNPTKNGKNDRPTDEEIELSLPFLIKIIDLVCPKIVVALGLTAFNTLMKIQNIKDAEQINCMKFLTGKTFKWKENILIGAIYHPSPRVIGCYRSLLQISDDLKNIILEAKIND